MEQALQSPFYRMAAQEQSQYLRNVSSAPSFYQAIPRGGTVTGSPTLFSRGSVAPDFSIYQQIQQTSWSSTAPDYSSYQTIQPSFGYPRTRDSFSAQDHHIPSRRLEKCEPNYFSPYMSDGGSWSSLSRSRNSSLSQFTPERSSFGSERSTCPGTFPPGSTPNPSSDKKSPWRQEASLDLSSGLQRLDELMNKTECLHINEKSFASFLPTLGNQGSPNS